MKGGATKNACTHTHANFVRVFTLAMSSYRSACSASLAFSTFCSVDIVSLSYTHTLRSEDKEHTSTRTEQFVKVKGRTRVRGLRIKYTEYFRDY